MGKRILIVGGPRIGKSTLSLVLQERLGISVLHKSHDVEDLGWSQSSDAAALWFSEPEWIIEGVQMARALRKWLAANPGQPLDCDIIYLTNGPLARDNAGRIIQLKPGQVSMTKGVKTVFEEIERDVKRRGARVHKLNHPNEATKLFQSHDQRAGANLRG